MHAASRLIISFVKSLEVTIASQQVAADDDTLGVNCASATAPSAPMSPSSSGTSSAASTPPRLLSPSPPKARFQEGMVDEISFLAPEMGPLAGVLVGVERGTWMMEGATVSSSRTAHVDR